MTRVIYITKKIFEGIFTTSIDTVAPFRRLVFQFQTYPILCIGAAFLVIGFSVGIIKRIIRS